MLQTRLPGKCPNWVGIQMGNHRTIIELNGEWGTAPCLIHDTEGEPSNHQFALLLSIYPMNFPWYSHETMEKMCLTNSDGFKWYTRGHPVVRMRYSATLRHLELFREDMGRFKGLPLDLGSKNHGLPVFVLDFIQKVQPFLVNNQPKTARSFWKSSPNQLQTFQNQKNEAVPNWRHDNSTCPAKALIYVDSLRFHGWP